MPNVSKDHNLAAQRGELQSLSRSLVPSGPMLGLLRDDRPVPTGEGVECVI